MKRCGPAACAVSIALMLAPPGGADNAVRWYERAIDEYESIDRQDLQPLWDWWNDRTQPPTPEARAALSRAAPIFSLVRRGAQEHYADWNLDYSQGLELVLPHLFPLRQITRLMHADAMVRLHDGDADGAADRLASIYRSSGHFGDDAVLISSLVGQASFMLGDLGTQTALDQGALDPFQANRLYNALKQMDAEDPFNITESIVGEQTLIVDWMAQQFATQEARQQYHDEGGWIFGNEAFEQRFIEMTDEEFAGEIDHYDLFMGRVVEAFMIDDPDEGRAALKQLEQEVETGAHGELAQFISPAFSRVLDAMHKGRARVAERLAELEKLAQGEIKPEELANAAVFYMRGIERLRDIELPRVEAVLEYQAGEIAQADESVLETLTEAQDVIDLFREGSEKRRCDFAYLRWNMIEPFCPDYLAGMRDALRVVLADAKRRLDADGAGEEGDAENGSSELGAATDRLAICYRAAAHLSHDELILSALAAHDVFNGAGRLCERAQGCEAFGDEHRQALLKAVERMARKDPFGYIGSIMATRSRLAGLLDNLPSESDVDADADPPRPTREAAVETVKSWHGDQLLYVSAARDTVLNSREDKNEGQAPAPAAERPHPLTRMKGIIDFEALVTVRDEAETIVEQFWAGRVEEIFAEGDFPRVAPVLEWMGRARGDLRDCLIRLRPPMAGPPPQTE